MMLLINYTSIFVFNCAAISIILRNRTNALNNIRYQHYHLIIVIVNMKHDNFNFLSQIKKLLRNNHKRERCMTMISYMIN